MDSGSRKQVPKALTRIPMVPGKFGKPEKRFALNITFANLDTLWKVSNGTVNLITMKVDVEKLNK